MLTRNRLLGTSLALALLAIVAALVVTGGREAVAQPPTANDRFDEILDELIRIRSEVSDLRAELTLTRGELTDVRAELAVVNARLQRLARTPRVAEPGPAEYTKAFVLADRVRPGMVSLRSVRREAGILHRVRIGPLAGLEEADRVLAGLNEAGLGSARVVIETRNDRREEDDNAQRES